jgi:hypothetical protein
MAEVRAEVDDTRLNAAVMPKIDRFVTAFTRSATATAKDIAPRRTGHLRGQIRAQSTRRVGPWTISSGIDSLADYSAPVHQGARPHIIRPRQARALRFEIDGRVIFARRVNHPGQRAQPYLRNAVHRTASADPRIQLGQR